MDWLVAVLPTTANRPWWFSIHSFRALWSAPRHCTGSTDVPQLQYVNDICAKVSPQTTIKLFADDCLLYRNTDYVAAETQLEQDLDSMV